MMVQEPFTNTLGDRNSEDFEALTNRLANDIEQLYMPLPGQQTVTVLNYESVSLISNSIKQHDK